MKYNNNKGTNIKCQEHPLSGKEYLCFQAEIRTEQEGQCAK